MLVHVYRHCQFLDWIYSKCSEVATCMEFDEQAGKQYAEMHDEDVRYVVKSKSEQTDQGQAQPLMKNYFL